VFKDSIIACPVKALHSGPVGTAVVSENVSGLFQHYQVRWTFAGFPVKEEFFPVCLQLRVLRNSYS
jgi:hypothetical protein